MTFTSSLGTIDSGLGYIELGLEASSTSSFDAPLFIAIVQSRFLPFKVVQRSTNQLDTVPSQFDVAAAEMFPYTVDVTNYLGSNDSISIVAPALTYLSTGKVVNAPWYESPIVIGNVVTLPINCSYLRYGQNYQVAVNFTASSSKKATYISTIRVSA